MTQPTDTGASPVRDIVLTKTGPRAFTVRAPTDPESMAQVKRHVASRSFDKHAGLWTLPLTPAAIIGIGRAFPKRLSYGPDMAPHVEHAREVWRFTNAIQTRVDARGEIVTDEESLIRIGALNPPARPGNMPLWRHQPLAYNFARVLDRSMLWMGMGTGKSAIVVNLVANTGGDDDRGPAPMTLIVAPKAMIADPRTGWFDEFRKHSPDNCVLENGGKGNLKSRVLRLESALVKARLERRPFVALINYAVIKEPEMLDFIQVERSGAGSTVKGAARSWDWVVFDESQNLKTHDSQQTKVSTALIVRANVAKRMVMLTGTPMPQSPGDIFSQFRIIDPAIFGTSYAAFKTIHAQTGGFEGRQIMGWPGANTIKRRALERAFHVSREVLDLPPFTDTMRTFDLEPDAQRSYDQLSRQMYLDLFGDGTATQAPANAAVKLMRLQQFTGGWLEMPERSGNWIQVSKAKQEALASVLDEIDADEPVVVFCQFVKDIEAVLTEARKLGRTAGQLSGKRNELGDWVEGRFNTLAVQMQSGGAGVNLTRARYCVYYSINWSLGQWLQSRARVHRPGQKNPVSYIHLAALGTTDDLLVRRLIERAQVVSEASPSAVETFSADAIREWAQAQRGRR